MTSPSDVLCASARLSAKQAGTNQPGEEQPHKNNNYQQQPRIAPATVDDANEDTQLHATFAKILLLECDDCEDALEVQKTAKENKAQAGKITRSIGSESCHWEIWEH